MHSNFFYHAAAAESTVVVDGGGLGDVVRGGGGRRAFEDQCVVMIPPLQQTAAAADDNLPNDDELFMGLLLNHPRPPIIANYFQDQLLSTGGGGAVKASAPMLLPRPTTTTRPPAPPRAAVPSLSSSTASRVPGISKKRKGQAKKVVCVPAPAADQESNNKANVVVPSDLWAWRKYGQKPIKGSPYPRCYTQCSKWCPSRRHLGGRPPLLPLVYWRWSRRPAKVWRHRHSYLLMIDGEVEEAFISDKENMTSGEVPGGRREGKKTIIQRPYWKRIIDREKKRNGPLSFQSLLDNSPSKNNSPVSFRERLPFQSPIEKSPLGNNSIVVNYAQTLLADEGNMKSSFSHNQTMDDKLHNSHNFSIECPKSPLRNSIPFIFAQKLEDKGNIKFSFRHSQIADKELHNSSSQCIEQILHHKEGEKKWNMVANVDCLLNGGSRNSLQLLDGLKETHLIIPRIGNVRFIIIHDLSNQDNTS